MLTLRPARLICFFPPRRPGDAADGWAQLRAGAAEIFTRVRLVSPGAVLVLSTVGLGNLSVGSQQSQSVLALPSRQTTVSISGWSFVASGIYLSTLRAGTQSRGTREIAFLLLALDWSLPANSHLETRPPELSSPPNVAAGCFSLGVAAIGATSGSNQLRCRSRYCDSKSNADRRERIIRAIDGHVPRHHGIPFCDDAKDFRQ